MKDNRMNDLIKVATAMDAYTTIGKRRDNKWVLVSNRKYDTVTLLGFVSVSEVYILSNEEVISEYHEFPQVMKMYYDYLEWKEKRA